MKAPRPPHPFGMGVPHRRKRALYVAFASAFGTGILWLIFHYFLQRAGEFGAEPHPLEQWWLRLHGASAFVMLWFAGVLWGTHARPALVQARWRVSGLTIVALLALLGVSGYLLYYVGDDAWRDATRLLHWLLGLTLALPLLIHIIGIRMARKRRRAEPR